MAISQGLLVRTGIYVEVPPGVAKEAAEAIKKMEEAGFVMVSDWHLALSKRRPLVAELQHMLRADVMIVWPSGLGPSGWLKIGVAAGAGMRIIALGALNGFDHEVQKFFMLNVPGGWQALMENDLMKLGTLRYKRNDS